MTSTAKDVAADLRAKIRSGELAPGTKLPTAEELAESTGLTRNTALRILNLLKSEGLVEYRPGRGGKRGSGGGTYVRERPADRIIRARRMERDHLGYYSGQAVQHWRIAEGTRAEIGTDTVPPDIAAVLGVEPGAQTVVRRRLIGDPGVPAHRQLTDSWLHPDIVEALPVLAGDTGLGGMYDRIEEWTGSPIAWEETVTAAMPSPAEAVALLLPPAGVPMLRILRTSTIRVERRRVVAEVNDIRMSAELFAVRYPMQRAGEARWPVRPATGDFYSG